MSSGAQVLAQMRRLIARLESVLEARSDIDRAIGILMSRSGGTEDEALVWLRSLSEDEHPQLVEIARKIINVDVHSGPPHRGG